MTQPTAPTVAADARHGPRTLIISSLAVMATFLDTTVLFVAFSDIARTFSSVSTAQLSWVLNAYTIAVAALLVPAGKFADRVGHKTVFLGGSALFTVASLACALAPTAPALIAFRVVQAIGGAALTPASFALVLRAFPPQRIPWAVAIWGGSGAVAAALGPTLGAALIEWASWRWVFLINLPIGLLTIGLGLSALRESRDPSSRVPSLVGVALIAGAGALLSLGAVQSDDWGWTSTGTVTALVAGFVLLGLFVVHQRLTPTPVLDLELFRLGNFRWANAAVGCFGVAFSAMFFGSVLFLTTVWQWSILKAGFGVAPGPLSVALLTPLVGRLSGRIGQRPLVFIGGAGFIAGAVWRVVMLGGQPDYLVEYFPSQLLFGVGVAFSWAPLAGAVGQSLPPNRLGVGGAASQAIRQFGATFGVAFSIALIGTPLTLGEAVNNYDRLWWLLAAGGLVTALLAIPLKTRHPAPAGAPAAAPVTTDGVDGTAIATAGS
jgi:EmrB/QacA subfamily drug resistance transporter